MHGFVLTNGSNYWPLCESSFATKATITPFSSEKWTVLVQLKKLHKIFLLWKDI